MLTRVNPNYLGACLLALLLILLPSLAQGTYLMTYQGKLQHNGQPYSGEVDLLFQVWTSVSGGSQVGPGLSFSNHPVEQGLFQVELDLGQIQFDGSDRFLAIRVDNQWLGPRQRITAAPVAIHALTSGSSESGNSPWTVSGNDIYYLDGRVGIGRQPSDFLVVDSGMDVQDEDYSLGTGVFRVMMRDPDTGLGVTKFRILGNGGVGIGGTYNSSGVPANGLRVLGDTRIQGNTSVEGSSQLGTASFSGTATFHQRVRINTTSITQDQLHVVGTTRTDVLRIMGGSDLAERFDVAEIGGRKPEPGMVVSIDPANPGHLIPSTKAYDRTVAGIISGANGINSGLIMGQEGTEADGAYPVALTGRVYVWADAREQEIIPGDLLTTSDLLGHAMAVSDHGRMQGAILGKAMTGMAAGETGLVMVLVGLQ